MIPRINSMPFYRWWGICLGLELHFARQLPLVVQRAGLWLFGVSVPVDAFGNSGFADGEEAPF